VQSDEKQASQLGLSGTPSLVAQGPKGEAEAAGTIPSYSSLEQAIQKVS
jgi:protein-disulfide isomerase